MKSLSSYNEQITNWKFEREHLQEYLRMLAERNTLIAEQTPVIDFHPGCETPSKNTCFINHEQGNPAHLAFHVGFPHQKRLHKLICEKTKCRFNIGVFFSLEPKDTAYFSGFDESPDRMIYFLDSASVKDARVQTNYSSGVISRYDLDDLLEVSVACAQELLREKHDKLNEKWVIDNTVSFNINEINELKRKYYEWLIVPDPVDVKY
jgi:hypothetical protein